VLPDVVLSEKTSFSTDVKDAAISKSMGIDVPFYMFAERPENELERVLFAAAMQDYASITNHNNILNGCIFFFSKYC
jgi:hypothetical protein